MNSKFIKKIVLPTVLALTGKLADAQNFNEWFHQKKTQIEYLVNQIAALQVYSGALEKGYDIAQEGLTAIHKVKNGDFDLHGEYFSSLLHVNPRLKGYWKITDIIQTHIHIVTACSKEAKVLNHSGQFTPDEIQYCTSVTSKLLEGCNALIDQLINLTTDGKLQLKDGERLSRIDALYADIKDKENFIQHFCSEVSTLAIQRARAGNDVTISKRLSGIQK